MIEEFEGYVFCNQINMENSPMDTNLITVDPTLNDAVLNSGTFVPGSSDITHTQDAFKNGGVGLMQTTCVPNCVNLLNNFTALNPNPSSFCNVYTSTDLDIAVEKGMTLSDRLVKTIYNDLKGIINFQWSSAFAGESFTVSFDTIVDTDNEDNGEDEEYENDAVEDFVDDLQQFFVVGKDIKGTSEQVAFNWDAIEYAATCEEDECEVIEDTAFTNIAKALLAARRVGFHEGARHDA